MQLCLDNLHAADPPLTFGSGHRNGQKKVDEHEDVRAGRDAVSVYLGPSQLLPVGLSVDLPLQQTPFAHHFSRYGVSPLEGNREVFGT